MLIGYILFVFRTTQVSCFVLIPWSRLTKTAKKIVSFTMYKPRKLKFFCTCYDMYRTSHRCGSLPSVVSHTKQVRAR